MTTQTRPHPTHGPLSHLWPSALQARPNTTTRLSRGHIAMVDALTLSSKRPTIHALLEVDVTEARDQMKDTGVGHPTMTALVIASIARAVEAFPDLNARRAGRRVVHFGTVDILATVERMVDADHVAVPFIVRDADRKTVVEIADELRADRNAPLPPHFAAPGGSMVSTLPRGIRRLAAVALDRVPSGAARSGPAIGVASVGMFGVGWGIPVSTLTLMATIGGVSVRTVLTRGHCFNHEFLPLTLSFDHTLMEGAPAARFATALRDLLESAVALKG